MAPSNTFGMCLVTILAVSAITHKRRVHPSRRHVGRKRGVSIRRPIVRGEVDSPVR
jgi:hypothetical protein